jgi:Flp pilus assembly protein TadB
MAFDDIDRTLVPLAAMLVPIVGSIALFSFLAVTTWSEARRKEREAYYTSETLKKIAESSGEGAKSALELLRERQKNLARNRLEGVKLGGLVTAAIGIGVMVLLRALVHDDPVYLAGLIPVLIGVALLVYAFVLAPRE